MQRNPQVFELTGLLDDRRLTVSLTGYHIILHLCREQGNTGNNKVRKGFISVTLSGIFPKECQKEERWEDRFQRTATV